MTAPANALIAAAQASEAVAELLRFHREGPNWPAPFGDIEVTCKLAEALKLAAEIERDSLHDGAAFDEEREALGQLIHACGNFIEGWAG
ncbi:hypothetical protein [Novosphingobium colocasiae]|uniref:Uncharacterized protein n=1 Tax=Novosphingobium colocasiae TaxID=1256513 RepID=A0A918PDR8_9SPHN|nr:hypothetical protein [Novosphingobium colocasiae]GGZ02429.1 hypothetical protein GCM10011614_16870 [Novosphingobium colocasiae]